jgi:hypothetical protein
MEPPPRRPAGMSSSDWFEALIRQAEAEGKFDDIASAPDPLAGIDLHREDDENWWLRSLMKRENLTIQPEMLEVRAAVWRLRQELGGIARESELRERVAALNQRIEQVNLGNTSPVSTDLVALDAERLVADWRTARRQDAPAGPLQR